MNGNLDTQLKDVIDSSKKYIKETKQQKKKKTKKA